MANLTWLQRQTLCARLPTHAQKWDFRLQGHMTGCDLFMKIGTDMQAEEMSPEFWL